MASIPVSNGIDDDSAIDVLVVCGFGRDEYGDINSVDYSCTQPVGFVNIKNDRNDLSNAQYPGAPKSAMDKTTAVTARLMRGS